MAHYRNRIFTSGIVWDPREPLPPELQPGRNGAHSRQFPKPGLDTTAAFYVRDEFDGNGQMKLEFGTEIGGNQARTGRNSPRFTVQEQGRNVLPPLSVKVDASIVQDTAQVAVTQLFWNDSTTPIKEAAFTFPLPTGCTITDFSCRIGPNKIIRGEVKPREEAREQFQRHIRTHDTAAGLLEQDTPEIFTTTLGNIPQKTKVKVNLTYITVLKHRFADSRNVTTLTIPTSIARRYGEVPKEYNAADTTNVPHGLTLEVEVVESEKITSITSPSHVIDVSRLRGARNAQSFADLAGQDDRSNVETAIVALPSGSMLLDKDFVLDIETAPDGGSENPQAWIEEHPTLPNHKALMLTLPPQFLTKRAPPLQRSEILFLADLSGSMSDKIFALKSAIRFFLKGIPMGRKFNIWCFGSSYTSWQPQSVEYGESTMDSALHWMEDVFAANMGGTELLPAIKAIVQARDKALMTDIIVLTDGEVWRLDKTLDYIQKTRDLTEGRVRFFALGIGRAVSHALVEGIAKAGGGYAEVVQEASQGGWEDRVVSMTKAALLSAHLGPLHLSFGIQDKNGKTRGSSLADTKRSPADVSALGPFERHRIYFLSDSIADSETITSVKLKLTANHETKTLVIPVTVLEKRDTMLHKLAARSMLDDLERGRSHIHLESDRPYPGSWAETNMVRKEAEEIACKWSLVSKWTSFFLAEEPYSPTEKDPFMDGVVEVKETPGYDLLQPREDTQLIGLLESVESDPTPPDEPDWEPPSAWGGSPPQTHYAPVESLSGSAPPLPPIPPSDLINFDFQQVAGPITTGYWERLGRQPVGRLSTPPPPSAVTASSSSVQNVPQHSSPPPVRLQSNQTPDGQSNRRSMFTAIRRSGRDLFKRISKPDDSDIIGSEWGLGSAASFPEINNQSVKSGSLPPWVDSPAPQGLAVDPEADFISSLLNHQRFDGSIDFGSWVTAEEQLGKEIADALRALQLTRPSLGTRILWTVAVHVLLERDLQSCKALWELMTLKAASYCIKRSVTNSGCLEIVKEKLEGLKLPLHQRKETGGAPAPKAVATATPGLQGNEGETHGKDIDSSAAPARAAKSKRSRFSFLSLRRS